MSTAPVYQKLTEKYHGQEVNKTSCCSVFQKGALYACIGACSVVLCGVTATLWAWLKYGEDGFHSTLILGPILLMIGFISLIVIGWLSCCYRNRHKQKSVIYQVEMAHIDTKHL